MKENDRMQYPVAVLKRHWLNEQVLELVFERPEEFTFIPGQKIAVSKEGISREYTLINPPGASEISFCVRFIKDGRFSTILAYSKLGAIFSISPATGYFTYQSQKRRAVFVATGTGIAPFLAYIRSGIADFILLHGVRNQRDLLYREEFTASPGTYMPCVSEEQGDDMIWKGRVTDYITRRLIPGEYDFYLCGNRDMIRETYQIVDQKFPGSRIFSEPFF